MAAIGGYHTGDYTNSTTASYSISIGWEANVSANAANVFFIPPIFGHFGAKDPNRYDGFKNFILGRIYKRMGLEVLYPFSYSSTRSGINGSKSKISYPSGYKIRPPITAMSRRQTYKEKRNRRIHELAN